jgi:hypothetical protein
VRGDDPGPRRADTGYGNAWPEDYRSEFSGQGPQHGRDAYSERQSGPYRSPLTGRPVSEREYRQETHWHRSRPHTGFSRRGSESGYEDPTWAVPQMGRSGGHPDERVREDVRDELSDDAEADDREAPPR